MNGVWFLLPVGPVRISTVLAGIALLVLLSWRRNIWIAIVAYEAWLSSYEIVFNAIGVGFFHWPITPFAWAAGALLGWVLLAAVLKVYPEWRLAALTLALFIIWALLGYHSNTPTRQPLDVGGEVLNEVSKSLLALAFFAGAMRLRRPQQKELVEAAVDGDRSARIGGRLQLHRVRSWLNRPVAHRVIPTRLGDRRREDIFG